MRKFFYGVFIIFGLLLVIVTIIEFTFPGEKIIHVMLRVHEAYSCKYHNGEWIKTNTFSEKDDVAICAKITSNLPDDDYQFTILIYKDGDKDPDKVMERNKKFSLSDGVIRIDFQFDPGIYDIEIRHVRDNLIELPIEVLGENDE